MLKKAYKNLPEERVRLQFVEYLLLEAEFSRNRISFESPVELPRDKSHSRTDLICYDQHVKPLLLAEIKRTDVPLNEKTALQVARYHQKIQSPYLMVTNGINDYWYHTDQEELKQLPELPDIFNVSGTYSRDQKYWTERGFISGTLPEDAVESVVNRLKELYADDTVAPAFLTFDGFSPGLALDQYYRIFEVKPGYKLAVAFTSTPDRMSLMNAILNVDGENISLMSVNLQAFAEGTNENTFVISANGNRVADIQSETGFNLAAPVSDYTDAFTELLS